MLDFKAALRLVSIQLVCAFFPEDHYERFSEASKSLGFKAPFLSTVRSDMT